MKAFRIISGYVFSRYPITLLVRICIWHVTFLSSGRGFFSYLWLGVVEGLNCFPQSHWWNCCALGRTLVCAISLPCGVTLDTQYWGVPRYTHIFHVSAFTPIPRITTLLYSKTTCQSSSNHLWYSYAYFGTIPSSLYSASYPNVQFETTYAITIRSCWPIF